MHDDGECHFFIVWVACLCKVAWITWPQFLGVNDKKLYFRIKAGDEAANRIVVVKVAKNECGVLPQAEEAFGKIELMPGRDRLLDHV